MEARDYLAIIRDKGGMTQVEIARRTGIPQSTISKIERGDVADVMSRNYRALQVLCGEVATEHALPPDPLSTVPAQQPTAQGV